jgi:hypothetical protein
MKIPGENALAGLGRSTLSPIQAIICEYFMLRRGKKKEEKGSLRGEEYLE